MVIRSDKKRILVTLSNEVYEKLVDRAKKQNRSISNMTATLILEQLKKNEK